MSRWKRIIIHHTATGLMTSASAIRRYHVEDRGWSDVGYHWLVEHRPSGPGAEFVVVMGRPMYRSGSHCRGKNSDSIGVALIGDFTHSPPPRTMVEIAAELCAGLCVANGIRSDAIHGHGEFGDTLCPGRVPIESIRKAVRDLRSGRWPRAADLPIW